MPPAEFESQSRRAIGYWDRLLNLCLRHIQTAGKHVELPDAGLVIKVNAGNDPRLCTKPTACHEY
jgi:hypothetical protein